MLSKKGVKLILNVSMSSQNVLNVLINVPVSQTMLNVVIKVSVAHKMC